MADDLPGLAGVFGSTLPVEELGRVRSFLRALEYIDRRLDPISADDERVAFAHGVLEELAGRGGDRVASELQAKLEGLRVDLIASGVRGPFLEVLGRAARNSERMRRATSISHYLRCIQIEGRVLVSLVLLLLPSANAGLRGFLRAFGASAAVFDKLVDATADYRAGEMRIPPGLWFRLRLMWCMVASLPGAIARHPRPVGLLRMACGYVRLSCRRTRVDLPVTHPTIREKPV